VQNEWLAHQKRQYALDAELPPSIIIDPKKHGDIANDSKTIAFTGARTQDLVRAMIGVQSCCEGRVITTTL
jgi:hypothetical protein